MLASRPVESEGDDENTVNQLLSLLNDRAGPFAQQRAPASGRPLPSSPARIARSASSGTLAGKSPGPTKTSQRDPAGWHVLTLWEGHGKHGQISLGHFTSHALHRSGRATQTLRTFGIVR